MLETAELADIDIAADGDLVTDDGVFTCHDDGELDAFAEGFVDAIAAHRHWDRDPKEVPA